MKNRRLNTDKGYINHQKEFFRMNILRDNSDKFDSLRLKIAGYASQQHKNKTVLEIATGHGYQAAALGKVGFSKIVAIDLVPERIKECKRQFPSNKIDFRVADASSLPFKDKFFDASVVSAALHDMPTKVKYEALREMVRVTKNTIVIFEPRTFVNPLYASAYGLAASIVDESLNISEYVADDLGKILTVLGLKIIKDELVWHNSLNIKVCSLH